jgi:hypothetical protein
VPRPPAREPTTVTEVAEVVGKTIERVTAKVVQFIVLEVHSNLVAAPGDGGTPVDTGHARSNWIPSVGQHHRGVAGSRESVNHSAQENGVGSVLQYRLRQGAVFVTNNVPYILRLNAGSSAQAPAGFVDKAVATGVAATEQAFRGGL